jgi:uncharacterized protein (DUF488 family)
MALDFPVIFTVGHSVHPIETFIEILQSHEIEAVGDVRRFPASRRHPQFNAAALAQSLPVAGIEYLPFTALGGRRQPRKDSENLGWKNLNFRGYADFLQTPEFLRGMDALEIAARAKRTAIMCAEALPWQCHRSLIADVSIVRGWKVMDIYSAGAAKTHAMTAFAVVRGDTIVYPAGSMR